MKRKAKNRRNPPSAKSAKTPNYKEEQTKKEFYIEGNLSLPKTKEANIVGWLALFVSMFSIMLSAFPQINLFSTDYKAKALAGDEDSQYILADQSFEIGEFTESMRWYLTLSQTSDSYQAIAQNNLACLYVSQSKSILSEYHQELALEYFQKSYLGGVDIALTNAFHWLSQLYDTFPNTTVFTKGMIWITNEYLKDKTFDPKEFFLPYWLYKNIETISMKSNEYDVFEAYNTLFRIKGNDMFYVSPNAKCTWNPETLTYDLECYRFERTTSSLMPSLQYISYQNRHKPFK